MPASEEGLPRQLGRYLVVEHLATGGMGAVYLALQSSKFHGVERPCVVKSIREGYAESRARLAPAASGLLRALLGAAEASPPGH